MKKITILAACLAFSAVAQTETAPSPRVPGLNESYFVTLAGERVYYEVGGQGSPIVFIHGIGGGNSSMQWRLNANVFTKNHRVYALDLPGFARSGAKNMLYTNEIYVQTIKEFIKNVVKEPSTVIASSLGAAYSIRIAVEEPNLINKMALVSPTGLEKLIDPPNVNFYNSLKGFLGIIIAKFLRSESGIGFFLYNQVYLNQRLINKEIEDLYRNNLADENKEYPVFAFISNYLNQKVSDFWPKVKQPTIIIWGTDDVNTPVSGLKAFTDAKPETKSFILPGRAIPNDESSNEFNKIISDFI